MGSDHDITSLNLLTQAAQTHRNEIFRQSSTPQADSDDDVDAERPIFDQVYSVNENEILVEITNFTTVEFRRLYSVLQNTIKWKWNIVRGHKSPHKPFNVLFITLTVLKHGGSWDFCHSRIESRAYIWAIDYQDIPDHRT